MQIKIRNDILLKKEFFEAVTRILQTRQMTAKACLELNKVVDELTDMATIVKKTKNDIILSHCSKDENNALMMDAKGNVVFPDFQSELSCRKALGDLNKEHVTVEMADPVTIYTDESITPQDLKLLGGLVQVREREVKQGT